MGPRPVVSSVCWPILFNQIAAFCKQHKKQHSRHTYQHKQSRCMVGCAVPSSNSNSSNSSNSGNKGGLRRKSTMELALLDAAAITPVLPTKTRLQQQQQQQQYKCS